jgi:hypothetical protein
MNGDRLPSPGVALMAAALGVLAVLGTVAAVWTLVTDGWLAAVKPTAGVVVAVVSALVMLALDARAGGDCGCDECAGGDQR